MTPVVIYCNGVQTQAVWHGGHRCWYCQMCGARVRVVW